jgi:acyl carrier protein/carbonic anhydrase/acetyltransferase-like protein (isoleucine patch superfamily)
MAGKWSLAGLDGVGTDLRRALWLRNVTQVGKDVVVEGRPFIANEGSFVIGDRAVLSSRPVQSHFVVGRGGRLVLGAGATVSYGAAISAQAEVLIGRQTQIGPLVVIMDSDFHVVGDPDARPPETPISIGNDVVIESRVTILRGSVIGDGARVRSGSVVSGSIAAGTTVAGVPAGVLGEVPVELGPQGSLDLRPLVQLVLGLSSTPELDDGPDQIPQWDSLGALKLLLAIERTFKVTLPEEQLKKAQSIALLTQVVASAQQAP